MKLSQAVVWCGFQSHQRAGFGRCTARNSWCESAKRGKRIRVARVIKQQAKRMPGKIISAKAIERRSYWVDEIVKISGRFGEDSSRIEAELAAEVKKDGASAIVDHLRLCGSIPERYGHDTSEEKL